MACWRAFLFFEGGVSFFPARAIKAIFCPGPAPMWDVSPGFPARFASRILAGRPRIFPIPAVGPCDRIFPSSFRGAVMSQRSPRGGSLPSGPARPGLPRPGSPRAVQERVVQGRPASPLGRGCNFWSCTLTVQGNRRFCHDHEMGRRRGIVDDCPDCGRGKDSRYPCCLECRRDRDAVDVGVPPSRSFPQARSGPGAFRLALPASAAAAARDPGPSALPGSATSAAPAATSARTSPACSHPVSASAASPNADPGGRGDVPMVAPESRF